MKSNIQLKRLIFWAVFYLGLISLVIGFGFYIKSNLNIAQKSINGEFVFSLDQQRYKKGESIRFTLANNSDKIINVDNNCPEEPLLVYQRLDNRWKRKHLKVSEEICPDQNRQIKILPNTVVGGSYDNWQELFSEPGIYRVVVYVEGYSGIAYQDLEILTEDQTVPQPVQKASPASNVQPKPSYPSQTDDYGQEESERENESESEAEEQEHENEPKEIESDD